MPKINLRTLCLVTAVLCNVERSLEHEIPRRSFLSRRAIDGTRGRKYFDPNEDDSYDSYGSAGGQYDPYDHVTDLSDIRKNVPGEPGVDYPAYTTLPQTGFTCEGRSRGYYADEAAGCQVFHVCHDVLVSSFLCPIGSTFSQKLLTCDWWNKVDCSSTNRYLEMNRGNYQIDDDEMIRNAYAMISLQSSAEDVTRDGLVDPDSGARIIDYSALGGRFVMGFTPPGFRRIADYAAVDATGNDLPSGFEDYSHNYQDNRQQIFSYEQRYQQKKTSPTYQDRFQFESKERSPYHASAIIQHDYQQQTGGNEYQNDYRGPDELANPLQASYAPTVPTVTTTTRRFYSPTVPTTYRPSTLAYSKLDLMVDSSDHLYAHSKTAAVTPPTIAHHNDDARNTDLGESETRHGGTKKSESVSSLRADNGDRNDDDVRSTSDEVRRDYEKKSETSFQINVTDMIDEDEVFRQQNDRPVIKDDREESAEDIEAKDSIGIAQALNNPSRRIIQSQKPVEQVSKGEQKNPTTPAPPQTMSNHSSYESYDEADETLKKLDSLEFNTSNETSDDQSTEDYGDVASATTKSLEETAYTRNFVRSTTLLRNWHQKDADVAQASTVPVTAKPAINTTGRSIDGTYDEPDGSSSNQTIVDQNSSSSKSISSFDDESRINLSFEVPLPAQFLRPPLEDFVISIPEETRHTTVDESSWNLDTATTETPQFSSSPVQNNQNRSPIYNENVEGQSLIDYGDEGLPEAPNSGDRFTAQVTTEMSTPIPWLASTWRDRSIVDVPVTDIVPPIVDYNDGFGDFVPPHEHSQTAQFDHTERAEAERTQSTPAPQKKNDSEAVTLVKYNTKFQFRDASKAQRELKSNIKPPCYSSRSGKQANLCETSPADIAISTPSVEEKTISIGITRIPELSTFSSNARSPGKSVTPVPDESSTFTTQYPIISGNNAKMTERPNSKTVTPRGVFENKNSEEKTEKTVDTTTNNLRQTIRPGTLKQIEEAKHENLKTTGDEFIGRLIAQHRRPASGTFKEELSDFEIVKSAEPEEEIATVSQVPELSGADHAPPGEVNNSFFDAINDTTGEYKIPESNVSMLNLLQLMAELLKLDRLPRPFSAKDLRSIEPPDSFNLDFDEPSFLTASPFLARSQARTPSFKASAFDTLKTPVNIAESNTGSLDLNFNEQPFITANPLLDYLQARTPLGSANFKASTFDTLKTPVNIAETKTEPFDLNFDEQSYVTASPLLDYSQARTPLGSVNFKTSLDTLKTPANIAESKTESLDLNFDEQSFVTASPLLDRSQVRTPFRNANSKVSSLDFKIPSNVATKPPSDVAAKISSYNATEQSSQSKSENKATQPLQKAEILEQLSENFGQPLFRGGAIYRSLVFDLPQVQRSLDFETGLPIKESEQVTESESEEENPVSSTTATTTQETTTITESAKTIVETEFVPSLGFSFDTNEDREEYVQAVLGGLIDEHTREGGKNKSSIARLTDEASKNKTTKHETTKNETTTIETTFEQSENSEDV